MNNGAINPDASNPDIWHAGRCLDLLTFEHANLLVATDTGGVWSIDGGYSAVPQSDDWDHPDMECLAAGPEGSHHFMAGCRGGLYETDGNATDETAEPPFYRWREVNLPPGVTTVHTVLLEGDPVIATDRGIWWAPLSATGKYAWNPAIGLPSDDYYGLALGSAGVLVGVGMPRSGARGLYFGSWYGAALEFRSAVVNGTFDDKAVRQVSICACDAKPDRAYALAHDSQGTVSYLLASDNGGATWDQLPMDFDTPYPVKDSFAHFFGDNRNGGPRKRITAHPRDPDTVGFGARVAGISTNGGQSWKPISGAWAPSGDYQPLHGFHEDAHKVHFDTSQIEGTLRNNRLYVVTDGGVVQVAHPADPGFKTAVNRNLANLQFLGPGVRDAWGTMAVGTASDSDDKLARLDDIAAGGLIDNSTVWCVVDLSEASTPWVSANDGDGGWAAIASPANQVSLIRRSSFQNNGNPTFLADWSAGLATFEDANDPVPVISVLGNALITGLQEAIGDPVPEFHYPTSSDPMLVAVAGGKLVAGALLDPVPGNLDGQLLGNYVFGLYRSPGSPAAFWRAVAQLPPELSATSVGPDTWGDYAFVGANGGRIFVIDFTANTLAEMAVERPVPHSGSAPYAAVSRIVSADERGAFALVDQGSATRVLTLTGAGWERLNSTQPLPEERLYALDINRGGRDTTLAVATDTSVWTSPDFGDTWVNTSDGLPRRPHCSDLRFGAVEGEPALFLSTWGRSMWVTSVGSRGLPGR